MANTNVLREQVKRFVDKANEKELRLLYCFFELNAEQDGWDEIDAEQQTEILASIKEADKGQVVPHEDMVKQYQKWLKK